MPARWTAIRIQYRRNPISKRASEENGSANGARGHEGDEPFGAERNGATDPSRAGVGVGAPSATAERPHLTPAQPAVTAAPAALAGRPAAVGRRVVLDLALIALIGLAALALAGLLGSFRPYVLFVAAIVVPGAAVVTALGVDDVLTAVVLSISISLGLDIAGGLGLAWASYWHPTLIAVIFGAASLLVLIWDLVRVPVAASRNEPHAARDTSAEPAQDTERASATGAIGRWLTAGAHVPLVLGIVAWVLSLSSIHTGNLGQYGLPPALPFLWYAGLALVLVGAVIAIWGTPRPSGWLIAGYVLGVTAILYATIPAITSVPQYSWLYKHVGVVGYIQQHGHTTPSIDIYNRWPGFFAGSAMLAKLAGLRSIIPVVGWAEPFFTALAAGLTAAIAHAISRSKRVAGAAALIFLVGNWVGQAYFSPQAVAFVLALALLLVVVRTLVTAAGAERVTRLIARVVRRPQLTPELPLQLQWPRVATVTVILVLDFVITASHQLTPYMLILQVGLLALLGIVRPWLVVLGMIVITVAYLLPNLSYVSHNYGLFTSIDPFNNVQHAQLYEANPGPGKSFNSHTAQALTFILWLAAAAGAFVLARRGLGRRALLLIVLAVMPFCLIFGNNYGGEASLRVILFSTPACAVLIAWALSGIVRPLARVLTFGVLAAVMAALFLAAYFGTSEINITTPSEVTAAQYVYAHASRGSVIMLSAPNFPTRLASNYNEFRGPKGEDDPNLLSANTLRYRSLGPADIPVVISAIHRYARTGFLVFSKSQTEYAQVFRLTPPGQLQNLERAVARSPRFRLWYASGDTRVYQLVGTGGGRGG